VASRLVRRCPVAGLITPPQGSIDNIDNDFRQKMESHMPKKQTSPSVSSLAGKILGGTKKPTAADAKTLAASVLSQDEKKGR